MDNNNMYNNNMYNGDTCQNQQPNDGYQQDGNYQQNPYNGNYNNNYNNNYNGNYQMPYQPVQPLDLEEPVSMGEWVITWLILMIPCVNIVMMFVWAFSKTEKKSKSNFFKAYLIVMGVVFALYFLIIMVVAAAGISNGLF